MTATTTDLGAMLAVAGATAAATLVSSEPLTAGEPVNDADAAPLGAATHAVYAPFAGARTGELLVVVDGELTAALEQAAGGPVDLADALAPTLDALAAAIGPVTLGPAQVTEARLGVNRVLASDDAGLVPLLGTTGPRAAVAISLERDAEPPAPRAADQPVELTADRLDLLRGVEMEATAELGRTRMTVNDLLALRSGAVIELDRVAGGPADLLVNGRLIARGEVVVVDENYGIRITQVVSDASGR
jgi:flagellar motor switch protein FliN/FliY